MSTANPGNVIPISRPPVASVRTDTRGNPVKNVLLLMLKDESFEALANALEFVELSRGLSLHEPGEAIEHAYFLNSGLCSLIVVTSDRSTVEVGVVGRDGIVGMVLAAGMNRSPHRAIMQMSGDGFRVRAEDLRDIASTQPEFLLAMQRYAQIQGLLIAQTAACNRLHEIEQRLARWLLVSQDRVGSESLAITHDFLSRMLGTGRPSVTLAAGILHRAGWISYLRGKIKIIDRRGLETAACQCYENMRQFNGDLGLT
jgi:CRP-like cAMP-binding protein